jgi:SOS response associated peptidase (SRAP)
MQHEHVVLEEEFRLAIHQTHNCEAEYLEDIVDVKVALETGVQWEGKVHVFHVSGHAKGARCYAWPEPVSHLVGQIHDRMPAILLPQQYDRWLGDEPDPRDLLQSCSAELMRMWPISTRVNKPENDDPSILDPIEALAEHYVG